MAYIKTLKDNELIGGTDNTDVYPISSTQAIYSQDKDGNTPAGVPKLLEDRLKQGESDIDNIEEGLSILEGLNRYNAVLSRDFGEFEHKIDETYADRASKDSLGRVIIDTYITREGLENTIIYYVKKAVWNTELPDGIVKMNSLSEALKELLGSNNTITNFPDEEDLMVKDKALKFADKTYDQLVFSGMGRKFLRKNMTDGVNYLEQYMLKEENTIYIIQYDYCMNEQILTVPDNVVLLFMGGSFYNGTLKTEGTVKVYNIGNANATKEITFEGNFIDALTGYEMGKERNGITTYRPTFNTSGNNIGFEYFDETLKKPVWWNGSSWTDATGAEV